MGLPSYGSIPCRRGHTSWVHNAMSSSQRWGPWHLCSDPGLPERKSLLVTGKAGWLERPYSPFRSCSLLKSIYFPPVRFKVFPQKP